MIKMIRHIGFVALLIAVTAGAGFGAEARPWLCRDLPVFSSDKPVRFEALSLGERHWRIFFMEFTPGGPHDGYSITASHEIAAGVSRSEGELQAGRFFTVGLYEKGGHWICPRSVREEEIGGQPGVVSRQCYGDREDGPCRVRVTITQQAHGPSVSDQEKPAEQ